MREFLRWLAGAVGAILMFVTSVFPEEAGSKVAAWAKFLGWENTPQSLALPSVDTFGFWVGFMLICVAVVWFVYSTLRTSRGKLVKADAAPSSPIATLTAATAAEQELLAGTIRLADAALRAFNETQTLPIADIAERAVGRDNILLYYANYLADGNKLFGIQAPVTEHKDIPDVALAQGRFLDDGHTLMSHSTREAYRDIRIREEDFCRTLDEMKREPDSEPVKSLPPLSSSETEHADEAFVRGYNHAKAFKALTKDDALDLLTRLRTEGVAMRNSASELYYTGKFDDWSHKVDEWKNDVAEALKPVSGADSKWFSTLDVAPPARVPEPNVRLGKDGNKDFQAIFIQHDCRLARLESLLKKHGIGA